MNLNSEIGEQRRKRNNAEEGVCVAVVDPGRPLKETNDYK